MTSPTDKIPEDVKATARGYVGHNHRWIGPDEVTTLLARRAIFAERLAERGRCAAYHDDLAAQHEAQISGPETWAGNKWHADEARRHRRHASAIRGGS